MSVTSQQTFDFLAFGRLDQGLVDLTSRLFGSDQGTSIRLADRWEDRPRILESGAADGDGEHLDLPDDSARFVTLVNHLPQLHEATLEKTLETAARIGRDFLYIQHVSFDDKAYLEDFGLRWFWTNWSGHRTHLTSRLLATMLEKLGLRDYVMYQTKLVTSSDDPAVLPWNSPRNQHTYDPDLHGSKPRIYFDRPVFKESICCVRLRKDGFDWEAVPRSVHIHLNAVPRNPKERHSMKGRFPTRGKRGKRLREVHKRLLHRRRWSYLRYLHLREGFLQAKGAKSVLAIGCGRGLAEIALAVEFPKVHFHLTDIETERSPYYQNAQHLAEAWELRNVSFGILDILKDTTETYDFVCSIEVLEHLEDDDFAASQMCKASNKYVFCLVPFGDDEANSDPDLLARVWARHEHFRVGYPDHRLRELFPGTRTIRGCYWANRGRTLREEWTTMDDEDLFEQVPEFQQRAWNDVLDEIPHVFPEALGIWCLSEVT